MPSFITVAICGGYIHKMTGAQRTVTFITWHLKINLTSVLE